MNTDRLKILVRADRWCPDILDGMSVFDAAAEMQALAQQYERDCLLHGHTVVFEAEPYGYDGGCDWYWYIKVYRLETDAEYNGRMAKEAAELAAKQARKAAKAAAKEAAARAAQQVQEAEELAEYERLRQKYGPR